MKDHRARSMGDTASAVGSMLLFVLFAVCMLMAVAVAADTYSRSEEHTSELQSR